MVYEVWDRGANMLTSGGSAPGSGERTGTVCSLSAFSRAIGPRCTGEASEHLGRRGRHRDHLWTGLATGDQHLT